MIIPLLQEVFSTHETAFWLQALRGAGIPCGPLQTIDQVFDDPRDAYTQRLLAAEPKGRPPAAPVAAPVVMEARDPRVWFPIKKGVVRRVIGHVKAVDGVSLEVRQGHTLGVVGESGSGKSSLGRALIRLDSSDGVIRFAGNDIQGLGWKALRPLRRQMQIVFQDPFGSLSPRSGSSRL